jgi:hypothetical protein
MTLMKKELGVRACVRVEKKGERTRPIENK